MDYGYMCLLNNPSIFWAVYAELAQYAKETCIQ